MRIIGSVSGLLLAFAVAGCTPMTSDLLVQQPELTATVRATPTQVRDCITSKHPGKFQVTPMGDGWMIDMADPGGYNAIFAVTITPEGDHTKVESHRVKGQVFGAPDYYTDSVVACSNGLH